MRPARCRWLGLLVLGLLVHPARADGRRVVVKDGAGLFKPATVKHVRMRLKELAKEHDVDLGIETVKEVPAEERGRFTRWFGLGEKARSLHEWASRRAEKAGVDGLYVVIALEPRYVGVVITRPDLADAVGTRDREDLRYWFAREMKDDPDLALRSGVDRLRAILKERYPPGGPPPEPISGFGVVLLVAGFLWLWVILLVVRARARRHAGAAEAGPAPAERLPALMGGMFGAMAASWAYDRLLPAGARPDPSDLLAQVIAPPEPPAPQPAEGEHEPALAEHPDNPPFR